MKTIAILFCSLFNLFPIAMNTPTFSGEIPNDLPVYHLNNLAASELSPSYTAIKVLPNFAHKKAIKPDIKSIQILHKSVESFVNNFTYEYNRIIQSPDLANLILQMEGAHKAGISHDDMADYSRYMHDGFISGGTLQTALIFLCLKNYHLATLDAPENLDFIRRPKISCVELGKIPHYLKLVDSIVTILIKGDKSIELFTSWLKDNEAAFTDYDSGEHQNFYCDFYDQCYKILFSKNLHMAERCRKLYRAVQIFENALQTTSWANMGNLGYEMLRVKLNATATSKNFLEIMLSKFQELTVEETIASSKRIAVLSQIIKRYFEVKKHKINPTTTQIKVSMMYPIIGSAVVNAKLLASIDNDTYAIQEFLHLHGETEKLTMQSDEEIDQQLREFNIQYSR